MRDEEFARLRAAFGDSFGGPDVRLLVVQAPGRTELAGNHTDHEGGTVIAGAIDRHVRLVCRPRKDMRATVMSEGHETAIVDLASLDPREEDCGTSVSLVRGLAAAFVAKGFSPRGFDAYLTSEVPVGSGLSSSAAYEVALAGMMNVLWAGGSVGKGDLALMAQFAENVHFGKPCGLMDQAACALGGVQHMDFADPTTLKADPLDIDFKAEGYALCITAVGQDHSANVDDYASVPGEMQAVARALGAQKLGQLAEKDLLSQLPAVRAQLGDRACLRALHYWREDRLVTERAEALADHDMDRYLELTRLSGASSAMYLQNVSCGVEEQPAMLALALTDEFLGGLGGCGGACRIHGGGFGGTIQAFVPLGHEDAYARLMDNVFGNGACGVYAIDHEGVCWKWL